MSATWAVVIAGILGLAGTGWAAWLSHKSTDKTTDGTLGLDTLRLALETQAKQITQQGARIDSLEDDVIACHAERDADRRTYRAELDQLRAQIGGRP